MNTRGTIIAALLAIELAIGGEAVVAFRGSGPTQSSAMHGVSITAGPRLVEGGPHLTFDAGAHPTLSVDIGYADLTIRAISGGPIDVSASASSAYGMFRETAPITARADGGTVRIATTGAHRWSIGDDRMVTLLLPAGTHVNVVQAGDIKASGLRGESSFKTVGQGSILVEDYAAPALQVAASSGRIVLHRIVAGRLDATSTDGRVEATALQVRDGSIESDGRVMLGFAPGTDTLVTAETNKGSIRVWGFTAPDFVATQRTGSDAADDHQASQTVRVGAGNGHLDVHASDGNINLAQEATQR